MCNKIDINLLLYDFSDTNMDHISQACQRGFNFMSRLCVCDFSHDCGLLFACPLKAYTQAFFNANDSYNYNNSEISNMFIFIDGGFLRATSDTPLGLPPLSWRTPSRFLKLSSLLVVI